VARECHSAVGTSPKAVSWSRDRGCKGHRILGRVPADRRHPGSLRGVGFHETASKVVLAVFASSDPFQPVKTQANGEDKEAGNTGEARWSVRMNEERDRGVRGSIACAPWEENAHARVSSPRGIRARGQRDMTIRRSGLGCRETSGPPIVSYGALVSVGRPRWATSEASRERTRCGCT